MSMTRSTLVASKMVGRYSGVQRRMPAMLAPAAG
jgi:hypothetical protein